MLLSKQAVAAALSLLLLAACAAPAAGPTATPRATSTALVTASAGATSTPQPTTPTATATVGGGTVDPCSLLTLADVSAATGLEYIDVRDDGLGLGLCYWNTDTSGTNGGDLIVAEIQTQELSFIKGAFGAGGTDATVTGHAAFWNPSEGLNSMWVDIGGGRLFVLSFPRSGDLEDSYTAIAQTLAEIAVGNL